MPPKMPPKLTAVENIAVLEIMIDLYRKQPLSFADPWNYVAGKVTEAFHIFHPNTQIRAAALGMLGCKDDADKHLKTSMRCTSNHTTTTVTRVPPKK